MTTEILGLDEIVASQAQKEVPHNTALRQIEAWVRALSITTAAAPGTPAAGDTYIVPAGATGVWAGQDNKLAHYYGGSWKFRVPPKGVRVYVLDEDLEYVFNNAGAWAANGADTADFLTQEDADAAYESIGAAAAAVSAHAAATDPHPQYLTQAEGDARYTGAGAATGVSSVNGKTGAVTLTAADVGALTQTQGDARYLQSIGTQPFDIHAFYPGVPSASAKVLRTPVARAVTFPDDFAGSYGIASVAATASTAFDIAKNGASVGTMTFAAGATTATFVTSGTTVVLAAGDRISIAAPASPDATLADVGIALAGTR